IVRAHRRGREAGVTRETRIVTTKARGVAHAVGAERSAPVQPSGRRPSTDTNAAALVVSPPTPTPAAAPFAVSRGHHTPRMSRGAKVAAAMAKAWPTAEEIPTVAAETATTKGARTPAPAAMRKEAAGPA